MTAFSYDVLIAHDGAEAINILKQEEGIDLLFTDVIMPGGMNGRELAETARRLKPGLKVFTSGYTENAIVDNRKALPSACFTGPVLPHRFLHR